MMSKPGEDGWPGISQRATCLLLCRHPAQRRRELHRGFSKEHRILSSDGKGKFKQRSCKSEYQCRHRDGLIGSNVEAPVMGVE